MIFAERRWAAALAEHEQVVASFRAECLTVAPSRWQRPIAAGKWTAAAVVLHVCRAYEIGRDAAAGGASMRMLVAPPIAWLARVFILRFFLAIKGFPKGASAPMEVVPDLAEASALGQAAGVERLERVCAETATALRGAARKRPMPTAQHAYFGTLTPYIALRLLSAHTRHHGRALAASRLAAAADTLPVDGAVPMLRP